MIDPHDISDIDLLAFVDDQLDPKRRMDVESYLARHPDAAARTMFDLSQRSALRLAQGDPEASRPDPLAALAMAFDVGPRRPDRKPAYLAIAAALVVTLISTAFVFDMRADRMTRDVLPTYLDDAVQSHQAVLVRAGMATQTRQPALLPQDIRSAIQIGLPDLPAGWRILDLQVFPSDEGPSVQMLIDAGERGRLSLFSIKADDALAIRPDLTRLDGQTVAFWQVSGQSFALIGQSARTDLRALAIDLSDNRLS